MTDETAPDEWRYLLQDYFGTNLTDQEEKRWFAEIRQKYHFVNNDRLCRAIRWAADPANWKHEARRVTVPEIITWIKLSYRQENVTNQPSLKCRACDGHGWVPHVKSLLESGFTLAEYMDSIQVVIPCGCSLGRAIIKKVYPTIDEARQLEVARTAIKQRVEYINICEELPEFNPSKPFHLPDVGAELPYDKAEKLEELEPCPF